MHNVWSSILIFILISVTIKDFSEIYLFSKISVAAQISSYCITHR